MTTLFLLRHGAVQTDDLMYGQRDVPLTEVGLAQARWAADALAGEPLQAVYSSDLSRARTGAELVASFHAGVEARADAAFREMSLGILEGVALEAAREKFPDLVRKRYVDMLDYAFPEGESIADVAARALPALEALVEQHAGHAFALVAHNTVNRLVLGTALALPREGIFSFRQSFGCINRIDYEPECARVSLMNLTAKGVRA
ncbi:MAG: histidine phosphatase family protein [Myxococcales bacterium]|nr:histidine phosphatase family protein [Myxococcales bacterium]